MGTGTAKAYESSLESNTTKKNQLRHDEEKRRHRNWGCLNQCRQRGRVIRRAIFKVTRDR